MYPHLLDRWRAAGAEILAFSPLADEAPDPGAHAVWLPGGYPELHAGTLASARRFQDGLRTLADRSVHFVVGDALSLSYFCMRQTFQGVNLNMPANDKQLPLAAFTLP